MEVVAGTYAAGPHVHAVNRLQRREPLAVGHDGFVGEGLDHEVGVPVARLGEELHLDLRLAEGVAEQ